MAAPTVKLVFKLLPDGFEHVVDVPPATTVAEVQSSVAAELQLNERALRLDYMGTLLSGGDSLETLGFGAGSTQNLTITVMPADGSLPMSSGGEVVDMSVHGGGGGEGEGGDGGMGIGMGGGEIEVVVNYDDPNEPAKVFSVRIEHASGGGGKRYLGGYRSRRTGLEYHHASSQTRVGPEYGMMSAAWAEAQNPRPGRLGELKSHGGGGTVPKIVTRARELAENGERLLVLRIAPLLAESTPRVQSTAGRQLDRERFALGMLAPPRYPFTPSMASARKRADACSADPDRAKWGPDAPGLRGHLAALGLCGLAKSFALHEFVSPFMLYVRLLLATY